MIPIHELLHRIRWDTSFGRARFEIAYLDRVGGRLERVPLDTVRFDPAQPGGFEATGADGAERFIPFHRVRQVYRDDVLIWHREPPDD